MLPTCVLTVCAASVATACGLGRSCRRRRAKSPINRRVTDGASNASPPATTRTPVIRSAPDASLSRKPLAPAPSASYTYSSRSNVVKMSTFGPGGTLPPSTSDSARAAGSAPQRPRLARDRPPTISAVAARPSSTGMRTSITTTSGDSWAHSSTAARPSPARPTTSMSGAADSSVAKPSRIITWSSTTSTRMVTSVPYAVGRLVPASPVAAPAEGRRSGSGGAGRVAVGQVGDDREAALVRSGRQHAAEHRHPLPHPDQPMPGAGLGHQRWVATVVGHGHAYPRAWCIPRRVTQCLLHDAVGGQVHAHSQRPGHPDDDRFDRQARLPPRLDQLVEPVQPRLRYPLRQIVAGAQQADHAAGLGEGLPSDASDGGERLLRRRR